MKNDVILVDLMNLAFRYFHTSELKASNGKNSGIVHGCLTSLLMLPRKYPNAAVVVCWDGKHSWRKKINTEYKASRKEDRTTIYTQIEAIKKILDAVGIRQVEIDTLEADDVIGILATKLKCNRVMIYSNDKDFYQLVNKKISVIRPMKYGIIKRIREPEVIEAFGVSPERVPLLRALCGDASDQIKAIKGIGPKKALELVNAGLNPSLSELSHHENSIVNKYKDIAKHWPRVYTAWVLSFIPRDVNYKYFSKEVQSKLSTVVKEVCKSNGRRKRVDEEKATYELIKYASEFELEQIISRRKEFFKIL